MLKKSKKWFTLIEIIVVIALLWIMAIGANSMLKGWNKREKVEIIASWIQTKIEEIQFNAISWKWVKDDPSSDEWKLPDEWKVKINPVSSTLPWISSTNANITTFYSTWWTQEELEKIIEQNTPEKDPVTVDVTCIISNWGEEKLGVDNSLDIIFKWINITDIRHSWTYTEDSCLWNIKELILAVSTEKSTFESKIKISKPAGTIELLRWN